MKSRNFGENLKNAAGTFFLLAAAFFVCSTILSMRAVFADPIAPQDQSVSFSPQAPRAGAQGSRTTRGSVRSNESNARTGGATVAPARTVSERPVVSHSVQSTTPVNSRNIVSRSGGSSTSRIAAMQNRNVRSRTATMAPVVGKARVSLTGSAIRGNATSTSTYTYLSNKLYTGNYSNIIDTTTGLISSEAYSNCLESYYTCMDEICTARSSAQRRCACAGRVKTFADAQAKLESANEELIKVSGELALLIANKGKDISSAFALTDAEKVMNCVSYKDMAEKYKSGTDLDNNDIDDKKEWCQNHMIYEDNCAIPSYCASSGNDFGFNVDNLDGSGSDILASLKSWAEAKDKTLTITGSDDNNLTSAYSTISSIVGNMNGLNGALSSSTTTTDSLAETWGYELFEYAHNNVCNRVLDSCFNGIYEACGTPPSTGRKCTNGSSTCPYNYNTNITVTNTGTYELNFVTGNSGTTTGSSSCYGYTTSTDPYSTLRGPVADARRSVLQKYALDANADCDAYGEELKTTAQNIGYQKVAAQQALQKKRLEFAQNETTKILADAITAGTNFNECINEIYDCYTTQDSANPSWSTSRIKTYCAQLANVPHCYENMICNPSTSQFKAVIDVADSATCLNSQDYEKNTCRNVVTLNEVLTKASNNAISIAPESTGDSASHREKCLQDAIGTGTDTLRNWTATQ